LLSEILQIVWSIQGPCQRTR